MVPGRPAWHTPLTLARFAATGLALGSLCTGHRTLAVAGITGSLTATAANLVRLARGRRIEWWGTVRLTLRWFGPLTGLGGSLLVAGMACAAVGPLSGALVGVFGGELIGRSLFYVTVVPLDMPGSFQQGLR